MPYSKDLAYIHDADFTECARQAAATVLKLLREKKIKSGLVVDLGCGSGVLAGRLTRAGFDVLGVDISESMLKLARKRAPKARFKRGSLFRTRLPKSVAVTAIGECVNYLFDPRGTALLAHFFRRIYRALLPGGVFVFDIVEPGSTPKLSILHFEGKNKDWVILVTKEQDARRRVLTRRMTIFRKVGRHYRRTQEVHLQTLYPRAQIARQLKTAGFNVSRLPGYGKEHFPPGRSGFVAWKPEP
jgi:SAM-dependent methyltransferase